ncbi:MAG TPA: outer membrane protein assembly factor BamA [Acidobacteriota bacterium]|nr:outer membrane protein assembly factor BamA [Acidobacteriota bacterium]
MPTLFGAWLSLALLFLCPQIRAQDVTSAKYEGAIIDRVVLSTDGTFTKVSETDLRKLLALHPGDRYQAITVKQSIQRLFNSHLFYDIQADVQPTTPGHVNLEFKIVRTVFVSRITFSGGKKLDPSILLREVSFREKEPFGRETLLDTVARLGALYQKYGYLHPEIKPELHYDKTNSVVHVDFEIHAGEHARVESLQFDVAPPANVAAIRQEIKTQPGEKYSGVVLDQDIQDLMRQFSLLGYLNAEVYLKDKENIYRPERNAVIIPLRINPKDFVDVEIRGTELGYDKRWELLTIYSQRSIEPVFVQESANNLTRYLQEQAHFFATVRSGVHADPPQAVIFEVKPGEKFSLGGIEFENITPVDEDELDAVLALKTKSFLSSGTYSSELVSEDAERIRNVFVQKGYINAQVAPRVEPRGNKAFVIFRALPGPLFHINSIRVVGNSAFDRQTLLNSLQSRLGAVYSPYTVALDRSILVANYENAGFSNIDFRSDIHYPFPGLADITYYLTEGDRHSIENVVITGNTNTRDKVIRRELTFRTGEPVSLEKVLASESNLYNLGVFNRVEIEEEPTFRNPFEKIISVHVEEAKRYTLSYGVGYEDRDPRVTVGLSNNNFLGMARTAATALRLGARLQRSQISYTIPRPFEWRLPTLVSLFAQHERKVKGDLQQDVGKPFDTTRLSALLQSERRLNEQTSLFFRYSYEKVTVSNLENLEVLFRENRPVHLSKLSAALLNDRRDDPLDATRGTFSSADLQFVPRFLGSEAQFVRLFLQQQYFRPLPRKQPILATAVRFGWLKPFGKNPVDTSLPEDLRNPIPISERFFAGGSTSLRGFRLDQAGPLVERTIIKNGTPEKQLFPIGGNALFIWNTELRFPLIGFVHGALFYDTGNVFRSIRDISFSDFSNAVGFGLRLNTPVGPVRADFGYNLSPPPNFKKNLFFFTIGPTF